MQRHVKSVKFQWHRVNSQVILDAAIHVFFWNALLSQVTHQDTIRHFLAHVFHFKYCHSVVILALKRRPNRNWMRTVAHFARHTQQQHTTIIIINTDKRHINNMAKLIVSLFVCLNWSIFQLAFTSGGLAGILIYCLSAPKHNLYVSSLFDFVFAISFLSNSLSRPLARSFPLCASLSRSCNMRSFRPIHLSKDTTWMEFSTFALILPSIFILIYPFRPLLLS